MPPAARVSDTHLCPLVDPKPHVGGPIQPPGVVKVLIGGMPAAVVGDICLCVSPVMDSILTGSTSVLIQGRPAARMGDTTLHGGKITSGCWNVIIGG